VEGLYSIFKSNQSFSGGNNLFNQDPLFESPSQKKFTLYPTSPAIDSAIPIASITDDLNGTPRAGTPDRGCYEK
jgi:hypothetical protein